jgi:hypothetical protein
MDEENRPGHIVLLQPVLSFAKNASADMSLRCNAFTTVIWFCRPQILCAEQNQ